jgi:hypothetical protein
MSEGIHELLHRNLHEVIGEGDDASASLVAIRSSPGVGWEGLGFLRTIIDAFQEALDLRSAAYGSYSLTDE